MKRSITFLFLLFCSIAFGQTRDSLNAETREVKLGISAFANGEKGYTFLTYTMDMERSTKRKNIKLIVSHSMYFQGLTSVSTQYSAATFGSVVYFPLKRLYFAVPLEVGPFVFNARFNSGYVYRYGITAHSGVRVGWRFKNQNTFSLSLNPYCAFGPIISNDPNIYTTSTPEWRIVYVPKVSFQFKL